MKERILKALTVEGKARGQLELGRRVLGQNYNLDQWADFTDTLRILLSSGKVKETQVQTAPCFEYAAFVEYEYTLP